MTGSPITPACATRSRRPIRTIFHDFNERMWSPAASTARSPARERIWKTKTGKANFIVPTSLRTDPDAAARAR